MGYKREFLEKYVPNKTFYLSEKHQEQLLDMGNTKFHYVEPADKINTLVDTLYTKIVLIQI